MNVKKVNKVINIIFICYIALLFISAVSADNRTDLKDTTTYQITSDLSNDDIHSIIDTTSEGDVIEFTSSNYDNISLIVNKPLKITSNTNSTINIADYLTNNAVNLGINNTFGFYFTQNASGSTLSGLNIISESTEYAIIFDSSNTIIENSQIQGAHNNILIKNANNISITNNHIHNAISNGIQIQNTNNSLISNNTISYNGRSGIETSNLYNSLITYNEIFFNSFNGISMYNRSSSNNITYNHIYENTNGLFINSQSDNDKILYNTMEYNRLDPNCELGGFETGNGVLFGESYQTISNIKPDISYNALMHNENFQAKNNPLKETFKLGPNYFDSNDGEHTFICPMLLAKILTLDFTAVSNGIGMQIYEDGEPVRHFATFDQKVNVDGKKYSIEVINGKAVINADSSQDHEIEVQHGEKIPDYRKISVSKYSADSSNEGSSNNGGSSSGGQSSDKGSGNTGGASEGSGVGSGSSNKTSDMNDGEGESGFDENTGSSQSSNSNSTNSILNNIAQNLANYGVNNSDVSSQSTSDNGNIPQSQGQQNVAQMGSADSGQSSSAGDSQKEGTAYEISESSKISKSLQNNSPLIVLSVILLVGLFVLGYRRRNEF